MKSIPAHNSRSPAPPPSFALCSPFKSWWFIVAQSPWLAKGRKQLWALFVRRQSERREIEKKKKKHSQFSFRFPSERTTSLLVLRHMKGSIHVFSFGGGLRGGGGGCGRHRGRAKMAAGSGGMKTVTFTYQSLHSVPRPGWASACVCTAAHSKELRR